MKSIKMFRKFFSVILVLIIWMPIILVIPASLVWSYCVGYIVFMLYFSLLCLLFYKVEYLEIVKFILLKTEKLLLWLQLQGNK